MKTTNYWLAPPSPHLPRKPSRDANPLTSKTDTAPNIRPIPEARKACCMLFTSYPFQSMICADGKKETITWKDFTPKKYAHVEE